MWKGFTKIFFLWIKSKKHVDFLKPKQYKIISLFFKVYIKHNYLK
jgi:hypothetical protein